jgi:hypothetical protein
MPFGQWRCSINGAREVTLALGGRWHGRYGTAPCPVCQPERRRDQNALTLADGKAGLLAHCKRAECDFLDILGAAGLRSDEYCAPDLSRIAQRHPQAKAQAEKRAMAARRLWADTQPIAGTLAEAYLRGRGISCALPGTLALVEGGEGFAVHRTYLRPDGGGKAGLPDGDKMMLGATAGGAARLSGGVSRLVVAEGIESALSLLCGLLAEPATVWAALSTSGMRSLRLPAKPSRLVIAADGDRPGRAAAFALATRAHRHGWRVAMLDPGDGADFNDVLTGKAVAA